MKEPTPEEMKQISGGVRGSGPLAALFDQLRLTFDKLFGKSPQA